ncbi:hypothetical protein BGX29_011717 [Mortierella sp. GBA35]|nr:hypothetical protein BGX29_011717 [Mortierella sp. GBA35]
MMEQPNPSTNPKQNAQQTSSEEPLSATTPPPDPATNSDEVAAALPAPIPRPIRPSEPQSSSCTATSTAPTRFLAVIHVSHATIASVKKRAILRCPKTHFFDPSIFVVVVITAQTKRVYRIRASEASAVFHHPAKQR